MLLWKSVTSSTTLALRTDLQMGNCKLHSAFILCVHSRLYDLHNSISKCGAKTAKTAHENK